MNIYFLLVFHWSFSWGDIGSIRVPMDHLNPNSKRIEINFAYENDFIEGRKTALILDDPLDGLFIPYDISDNIKQHYNIVRILGRHQLQALKEEVMSFDTIDWKKAYQVYNQHQIVSDIELIRKKILGDKEVMLIGFSSSAGTFNYYISQYPEKVSQVICLSPLVFDIQRNLRFDRSTSNIEAYQSQLSKEQFYDFFHYSSFDLLNGKPQERNKSTQSALFNFKYYLVFLPGFSSRSSSNDNIGFKVRVFEHSFAYDDQNVDAPIEPNIIRDLMREMSKELWEVYLDRHFDVLGVHYDKGFKYLGNIFILGGAYDLLINSNSFEILAEFYRHSTLLLLKDGHSLNKIRSAGLLDDLMLSIMENDFDKKVAALEALHHYEFVFTKKTSPLKKKRYW